MLHDNDNAIGEPLRFLSVCSGIEAASVAWKPLGWQCIGVAEIEPFPAFVLAHHYGAGHPHFMPDPEQEGIDYEMRRDRLANIKAMSRLPVESPLPNYGDFTKIDPTKLGRVDILCGGTPCQAFSVAGLRGGLNDARGNLTLAFVELAHELAAGNGLRNVIWENVVGVLSDKTNAFGSFLAGLVGADSALQPPTRGKWGHAGLVSGPKGRAAWRVQDAQFHGLAQRRRRVLVVADFGNGADPAQVLFELEGVQRHTAPSREAGKDVAPTISARTKGGGGLGTDFDLDGGVIQHSIPVAPTMRAGGNSTGGDRPYGTDVDTCDSLVAFVQNSRDEVRLMNGDGQIVGALAAEPGAKQQCYVAQTVAIRGRDGGATAELGGEVATALRASQGGGDKPHVLTSAVRRLTPTECERLMGFPDGYTDIPWRGKPNSPDGPRYKALGNSWAVPKFTWLGRRIAMHMPARVNNTTRSEAA